MKHGMAAVFNLMPRISELFRRPIRASRFTTIFDRIPSRRSTLPLLPGPSNRTVLAGVGSPFETPLLIADDGLVE
jgi:hypothetical protein